MTAPSTRRYVTRAPPEEQVWLTDALRAGIARPAVRVWIHSRTAVVLGCSGRQDAASAARARAAGVELCVRPSGGGAVLAGPWMMSTSVVLPTGHPLVAPGIARSFAWLGSAHCDWLQRLGITARSRHSLSSDATTRWGGHASPAFRTARSRSRGAR